MRTRNVLLPAALLLFAGTSLAGGPPGAFLEALERALDSEASWTMERSLPGTSRTICSSGIVECKAGRGIAWKTLEPFAVRVEMRAEGMIFEDEDGRRFRPAESVPHYGEIRAAADAVAAGEGVAALEHAFRLEELPCGEGGWRVELVPHNREFREFLPGIELSGAFMPTGAVLRTRGGGVTSIRFEEKARER